MIPRTTGDRLISDGNRQSVGAKASERCVRKDYPR